MMRAGPGRRYTLYRSERRPSQRRRSPALGLTILVLAVLAGAGAAVWLVVFKGQGPASQAPPAAASGTSAAFTISDGRPRRSPGPGRRLLPGGVSLAGDGVKVSTFLGNETRRFYGLGPAPKQLDLIWRATIGSGKTSDDSKPDKPFIWSGTGWTGQPALVQDAGRLYLITPGYDHNLRKIEAETGEVVWTYDFGDVIKSSPTVFANPEPSGSSDRYIVAAGSRRGFPKSFGDPTIAPYRAVTFGDGKELWRLPAPLTACYSRDCDGSGFFLDGRLYAAVESGLFYTLNPVRTQPWQGYRSPVILDQQELLGDSRAASHGGNLVLEASPALLNDVIYIASGSGHVYGIRRSDLRIVFDFYTGSDMDGSTVTTTSGKIVFSIEKQYISGHGGVMMLDPSRARVSPGAGSEAIQRASAGSVEWFFPTGDVDFQDWEGGVIGSTGLNDEYDLAGMHPRLAAFSALDGNLYVVAQDALGEGKVRGPNGEGSYATPRLVFKTNIGGSISTPIFVDNSLIAAGYDAKVHLYTIDYVPATQGDAGALQSPDGGWWQVGIRETATFTGGGSYESTPIVWNRRVYIGSRDGSFYCLGDPR